MFGYVLPYKTELLVREYEQYKSVYCELCRELGKRYGWTARFTLSYDCTFYALLSLAVTEAKGGKCERCWMHSTQVGQDADHPTLCPRCAAVVAKLPQF